MVIASHMLAGAAIGVWSKKLWTVFVFGLLSHYLLDFIPHWDYLSEILIDQWSCVLKIAFDFALGISLVYILLVGRGGSIRLVVAAIVGALLPDFAEFAYNLGLPWLTSFSAFHNWAHHWRGLSFWQGLPGALAVIVLAVWMLRRVYPLRDTP